MFTSVLKFNVHFCILTVSYNTRGTVKLHCSIAYATCLNSYTNLMEVQYAILYTTTMNLMLSIRSKKPPGRYYSYLATS